MSDQLNSSESQENEAEPVVAVEIESRPKLQFIDRPLVVLLAIFLFTAAFGLPLLWQSRGFSRPSKVNWTIVVIAYTGLICWGFYLVMRWCYGRIAPFF